jgi:uncharacterized protein YqeY
MSSTPSALLARIQEDVKAAMRAKDSARLTTIRMLTAAIKQREVDERITLSDADVLALVDKLIKQRKDSISQFRAANRLDLVEKEEAEVVILSAYLPAQLSVEDIDREIRAAIHAEGATGPQAMGKVMGRLKPNLAGRADMTQVAQRVKTLLAG